MELREIMNTPMSTLEHFGVKGMKWGVRKAKDQINSKDRTISKGTNIQNITKGEYKNKEGKHLYVSYTKADNAHYVDNMAQFMYDGKGYRNEFRVKKDIKIPSDKKLTEAFVKVAKENPEKVARDMSKAYEESHLLFTRSKKYYMKKIKDIDPKDLETGEKLTKTFISDMVSSKAKTSRSMFIAELSKQGYDAISDTNDRDQLGGTQDPLIIFNPGKTLSKPKTLKLTPKAIDHYVNYTMTPEYKALKKDLSVISK